MIVALLAAAVPSSAVPLDCAKNPKRALPALIKRAMKNGSEQVLSGISLSLVGWAAPTKALLFPGKDGSANSFTVLVTPGKSPNELKPTSLVLLRSVASPGKIDRTFVTASLSGKLEAALEAADTLKGGKSTGTKKTPLEKEGPRARQASAEVLSWACGVVANETPSYQEQLAAQAKKIGVTYP